MGNSTHVLFVIGLKTPFKQGKTHYPHILIKFPINRKIKVTMKKEILTQAGLDLPEDLSGVYFEVFTRVFKAIIKINVVVPDQFKTHDG